MSYRRVGKAKRAHHLAERSVNDGGHVACAPLPTLRLLRGHHRLRAIGQPRGNADRGAAGGHVMLDDRAGADLGEIADADVADNGRSGAEINALPIFGARSGSECFRPMVTFCRIVTSSPITAKAPMMMPVA